MAQIIQYEWDPTDRGLNSIVVRVVEIGSKNENEINRGEEVPIKVVDETGEVSNVKGVIRYLGTFYRDGKCSFGKDDDKISPDVLKQIKKTVNCMFKKEKEKFNKIKNKKINREIVK